MIGMDIINLLMGNYCENSPKELEIVLQGGQIEFLNNSWQLLKRHKQLAFLSPSSEEKIFADLLALPKTPQRNIVAVAPQSHIYAVYKYNCYFYLGEVAKDTVRGKGALVLPNQKIYIGQFTNNKIQGKGELNFKVWQNNNSKSVKVTGNWDKTIKGEIQVQEQKHKFAFLFDKAKIKQGCNSKYIQYPNYDEYIGQTEKGLAHGQGRYTYRNGDKNRDYPVYQGLFANGLRHGRGILRYSQNIELDIGWIRGKPNGPGYLVIDNIKNSIFYRYGTRIERIISDYQG